MLLLFLLVNLLVGRNHTIGTQQHLGFLIIAVLCYFLALLIANVQLETDS